MLPQCTIPNKASTPSVVAMQAKIDALQKRTRVAERLSQEPKGGVSNRPCDLADLPQKYQALRTKLGKSIQLAMKYQKLNKEAEKTRYELAESFAALSEDSPLAGEQDINDTVMTSPSDNFLAQHAELYRLAQRQNTHFQAAVLDYLTEWESIIQTRVDSDARFTISSKTNRFVVEERCEHYRSKVAKLQEQQKKSHPKRRALQISELLQQNEMKFAQTAKDVKEVQRVMRLIVQHAWQELIPVMNHWLRLDHSQHQAREAIMERFPQALEELELCLEADNFIMEIESIEFRSASTEVDTAGPPSVTKETDCTKDDDSITVDEDDFLDDEDGATCEDQEQQLSDQIEACESGIKSTYEL